MYSRSKHRNTHTHPNTRGRSGGAQRKPEPKHVHPHREPQPGVAEYKRSKHRSTHTHTPTPQPEVAGCSRNPSPSTHTDTAHPSQGRRGTGGAPTQAHGHLNTPARSGRAQPKPEPKHTHSHRTPQPGVAGYKRSKHTNTHTPEHPSQEWQGAAETLAQAQTPTPHTPARIGGVQAERAHKHTQAPTPQPGVAGRSRNLSPSTHTRTAHPSQEWLGTIGAATQAHKGPNTPARSGRAQPKQGSQTHTPTPHSPARSDGVEAGRAHKHTQAPTPQPGVAGRSRNPSPSTHTHTAHPSQEWRGTGRVRTQTYMRRNPRGSPDFLAYPVPKACMHACSWYWGSEVLGCRTLCLESQSSAGLRMQPYPRSPDLVWPGHLHGRGCLSARAMDTGFPTVVRRLCLGLGCGWARVSAASNHSWLGCWGVCALVCVLHLYPAIAG